MYASSTSRKMLQTMLCPVRTMSIPDSWNSKSRRTQDTVPKKKHFSEDTVELRRRNHLSVGIATDTRTEKKNHGIREVHVQSACTPQRER